MSLMTQIILILLAMIVIGAAIYVIRYKDKGKPKTGIKRDNNSEYFKDYINLKLYWTSLGFIFLGVTLLIVILILELVFS
ncbi:hypothetical protein FLGSB24_28120 [Flavobacterium sp. GSB-24]|nr:hypothetical protein FLGSB24_28120 [Flavobacterium sp. GSB-24]